MADVNSTEGVDPVTMDEFTAVLNDACTIVGLIFAADGESA